MTPVLYSYWRSSAAYRVRMALNLKGVTYETVAVHLLQDGGQHKSAAHLARNPLGLVPALAIDGVVLSESLAIIDYLDETRPGPALWPQQPGSRAVARALALHIACNIHPLNNLRVVQHLKAQGWSEDQTQDWMRHWMCEGFAGAERLLAAQDAAWRAEAVHGGVACFVVPQLYNARRFDVDMTPYPMLTDLDTAARAVPAVQAAAPEAQPDAVYTPKS